MGHSIDHLPPQNREAERSVLGSMIRDNDCIADVTRIVRADDFYADSHQKVFRAALTLWDARKPVDAVTLAEELHQRGQIEDVGGYGGLGELWEAAPTAANVTYYAGIVRETSVRRGVIHFATELLRDAYQPSESSADLIRRTEQKIFSLSELGAAGEAATFSQALQEAADALDLRATAGEGAGGLTTGLYELDALLGGLRPAEVIFIAARPSVGKTALAGGVAAHVASRLNQSVLFSSLEMSKRSLAERFWCADARVDSRLVHKGLLSGEQWQRMIESKERINAAMGRTLFIEDSADQDMLRIAANARRLKRRENIGLLVIDYLQLIESDNTKAARWEQVGVLSRRLKSLAKELDIPLIVLTQLNRESESRKDGRPKLADLREGGQQEQDADIVILLHRPDQDRSQAYQRIDAIVAKNRNGPIGEVTLTFDSPHVRFTDYDPVYEPQRPFARNGRHAPAPEQEQPS